ncbi:MAG: GNAT family N-acetyltransferase [bacterium]|nr:GNAT family N-acetyltransferase [bacterium]
MFSSINTDLRDGTPVLVRPVCKDDKRLLQIGFEHLSEKGRFFRFFRPVHHLSDEELKGFTEVDQINHIAIGAIDLSYDEDYPIGVARCIRMSKQPEQAEFAVTVADSHQGRGLGTILLAAVAYAASAQNISAFVATVLTENHSMIDLFGELDATSRIDEPGVLELNIPIYKDAEKYPTSVAGQSIRKLYEKLDLVKTI